MKKHGWTARECIGWLRIVRPGSVLGGQQEYLEECEEAFCAGKKAPEPMVADKDIKHGEMQGQVSCHLARCLCLDPVAACTPLVVFKKDLLVPKRALLATRNCPDVDDVRCCARQALIQSILRRQSSHKNSMTQSLMADGKFRVEVTRMVYS